MGKRRKKVGNSDTTKTTGDSRFSVLTDEKDTYNPFKGLTKADVVREEKPATDKKQPTRKTKNQNPNLKKKQIVQTFDEDVTFEDIFSSWESGRSLDNVKKKSKNSQKSQVHGDEDFASVFAKWERSQGVAPKVEKKPIKKSDNYKPTKDFGQLLNQFEGNNEGSKKQQRMDVNQILKRTDNDLQETNTKNKKQKKTPLTNKVKNISELPKNYKIISQSSSAKQKENNKDTQDNKFENKNRNKVKKINNEQTNSNNKKTLQFEKSHNNKKSAIENKVVLDKALADKALADKALADKALADKALADKALADKALADKALADKALADKALADKALADKVLADKALADKALADKVLADKALADKVLADKALADKALADKALADKALADKALADKALADKALADKALADKALADKALADKAKQDNQIKAEDSTEKHDPCSWNVDKKVSAKYSVDDEDSLESNDASVTNKVNAVNKKNNNSDNSNTENKKTKNYNKNGTEKKRAPFIVASSEDKDDLPSKWNFSDIYNTWTNQNEEDKAILEAKKLKDRKDSKGISISYLRSMSPQAEIDLHGLTSDLAMIKTREFLEQSRATGLKKVSIITGKGIHSKDGKGILQEVALSEIRLSGIVREAYNPKAIDGGSGVIWVIFKSMSAKKVYF